MFFLSILAAAVAGDTVWVTEDVQSLRFPDDDRVQGPFLSADDEVEVLLEEGRRVRIRKGVDYGWIPASKIRREEPADDTEK